MGQESTFLAFDLGAESGRAVAGSLAGGKLALQEIHRFPNGPVQLGNHLHWDALRLWSEIQQGLALAAQKYGDSLASLGLDTWGVDFALLAEDDTLLGNPYHYRDERTNGMVEKAFQRVPRSEIYAATGIQFIQLNSLYQLLAMVEERSPLLMAARSFLTMPDLFNFWLCGRKANEFSIATTTQCYNPTTGTWAWDLLEHLDIPRQMFGEIVPPATRLGDLRPAVAQTAGCKPLPVIAPACHDTGSAVAAVPASTPDYIYISSGTWSLIGVEIAQPVINEMSLAYDFTNEGGLGGTFRFLKNIMGLWLVQECRREWARDGSQLTYDELTQIAEQAPAFGPIVVPGDSRFMPLGDMPARIQAFCRETGQAVPETRGEIVRCALESLALEYRWASERLDTLVGKRLGTIHIIGGGSRNRLLNQLTADAAGRTVLAGPVEATAIGNVLGQALSMGRISSLAEGRALVRKSFEVIPFEPRNIEEWETVYQKYLGLRQQIIH